jgi:hypothetical protein
MSRGRTKVSKTDLERLGELIAPLDTWENRQRYVRMEIDSVATIVSINMRHRWDLYWSACPQGFAFSNRHELNDAHIDTALRSIVPLLFDKEINAIIASLPTPIG